MGGACALLATACQDATGTGSALAPLVLGTVGAGYTIPDKGPNGPLTLDQAATATPADPAAVKQRLGNGRFSGAFERVWRSGDQFVSILVYSFADAGAAASFATFEQRSIAASGSSTMFSAGRGPGEQVFTFVGATRAAVGTTQFCEGAWYAVESRAVEVTHCGASRPGYPNQVIDLANQELDLLTGINAGAVGTP
jgi:hypothetical protein